MVQRWRALSALTVAAAMLLAPASASAAKPLPKSPQCVLSAGVTLTSMKLKNVTSWVIRGTSGFDTIDCSASTALVGVTILGLSRNGSSHEPHHFSEIAEEAGD